MDIQIVERKVAIAAPIEAVYGFHLDFENLEKISPSWMRSKLLRTEGAGKGKILELEITQFSVFTSKWVVRVEEYDPPFKLSDLVLSGPLPYFHHIRTFTQPCAEMTEMQDRLEYKLPFGFIGAIADKISVHKMMEQMFEHRHRMTKQILEEKYYIKTVPA
jgi:ligand-binding SRPBCC domain-containing protein